MRYWILILMLCGTCFASLAPWPVQPEYYGVLGHWRFNDHQVAGARLEMGKVNFSGSDTTVEVPTKMRTHIRCGFGVTEDQTAVSQDGVITAGAVTFTRPAGGTSGAGFNYILIGH